MYEDKKLNFEKLIRKLPSSKRQCFHQDGRLFGKCFIANAQPWVINRETKLNSSYINKTYLYCSVDADFNHTSCSGIWIIWLLYESFYVWRWMTWFDGLVSPVLPESKIHVYRVWLLHLRCFRCIHYYMHLVLNLHVLPKHKN